MTIPESYGTFSHLCASVVHESASSTPATRWRKRGETAAQIPKAPSTCSHARASRQAAAISGSGSKAPVFTSPAWAQTMVGPDAPSSASRQRVDAHAALVVRCDRLRRAEAEQSQRPVDRHVPFLADEDANPWRSRQAFPADVPARVVEHVPARGRERR